MDLFIIPHNNHTTFIQHYIQIGKVFAMVTIDFPFLYIDINPFNF